MPETLPPCPACASEFTYESGALLTCPMCGHEWSAPKQEAGSPGASDPTATAHVVKDAVGNLLADGDTVVVTKSVKVKGSLAGIKAGTKVRGIRLIDPVNGHDIDCKVDGFGPMLLKSSVVKKA
jgi:protein PhnA